MREYLLSQPLSWPYVHTPQLEVDQTKGFSKSDELGNWAISDMNTTQFRLFYHE